MIFPIQILGMGKSLSKNIVFSSKIDELYNLKPGTTEKITSLKKRHLLHKNESVDDFLKIAIDEALKKSKLNIDNIDCIISASAVSYQAIPYNAAYIHKLLKPNKPISTFDINMTCLGVLRAFDIASKLFYDYKNILIVSCDLASLALDWTKIQTAGIFADGATAMIVSSSDKGGIILSCFETYSSGYEYCQIRGGGTRLTPSNYKGEYKEICNFEMDGKKLYKLSSQILPNFIEKSLASKNLTLDDIDWIVPHQASKSALNHIVKILNLNRAKLIDIFDTHANQVASSIPSALYTLLYEKNVKSGQKVLIVGTSAGIGLGLVIWEIP